MLAAFLKEFSGNDHAIHSISIDKSSPLNSEPLIDIPDGLLKDAVVVLIDDVQNSGKTMMYAIRHFLQYEVKSIQTCVLVDRGHNRFPVHSDFVGLSLSTTLQNHVSVEFTENEAEVYLG
jgi:pyrimidine operon attenuation protein/uracil phosphoribosyltransferase